VRGAPVFNSHGSFAAAPQVGQGTENICFTVSSLDFTTAHHAGFSNGKMLSIAHFQQFEKRFIPNWSRPGLFSDSEQ
jgi:hypothetical protein